MKCVGSISTPGASSGNDALVSANKPFTLLGLRGAWCFQEEVDVFLERLQKAIKDFRK